MQTQEYANFTLHPREVKRQQKGASLKRPCIIQRAAGQRNGLRPIILCWNPPLAGCSALHSLSLSLYILSLYIFIFYSILSIQYKRSTRSFSRFQIQQVQCLRSLKPFWHMSRIRSGHAPELNFQTCSTQLEGVSVRRFLSYWKSVCFRRGVMPG